MTEPMHDLLQRAVDQAEITPPALSTVRDRVIRRQRHRLAIAVASCLVAVTLVSAGAMTLSRTPKAAPSDASTKPAAAGFLTLDDLHGDWVYGRETGDSSEHAGVGITECPSQQTPLGSNGRLRTLRGVSPEGAELLLLETVSSIAPDARHATETALAGLVNCPNGPLVVASGSGVVVTGFTLPSGAIGYANGYAFDGSTLVRLEALPGGAAGGVPLPGQTQWLLDVLGRAMTRATGRSEPMPAPNEAGRAAAARYAPPDPSKLPHVDPYPGTSAAGKVRVQQPTGFLTPGDFDDGRLWTSELLHDPRSGGPIRQPISVPRCGMAGLAYPSIAADTTPVWFTTNDVTDRAGATQTRIDLSPEQAGEVRTALAQLRGCATAGYWPWSVPFAVLRTGPESVVLGWDTDVTPGGQRSAGRLALALNGNTLMQFRCDADTSSKQDRTGPDLALFDRLADIAIDRWHQAHP